MQVFWGCIRFGVASYVGVVNRKAFENVLDRLLRPEAGAMTGLKTFD